MMRTGLITALAVLSVALVLTGGCATTGRAVDERAAVQKTLADWKAAIERQDIDAMMVAYSEDFTTSEGNTKAEVHEFFSQANEAGYLDGVEADLAEAEIVIEEGVANVGPIMLSSNAGALDTTLVLKKEADGVWRIVESEMNQ